MQYINAISFFIMFWIICLIVIMRFNRKEKNTWEIFLLSNRNVGLFLWAISIAAAWTWAPALFVASQKAFEQWLPGLFWFTFPNIMAIVLFSFIATRMRKIFDHGYTLPEYIKIRFDKKMQIVYMISIFVIQSYSVILQLTAALLLLNIVTGIEKNILILILWFIILSLSLIRWFRSSLVIDTIKALSIAGVCAFIVPWVINLTWGPLNIVQWIWWIKNNFTNIFDLNVALAFGIPISISLLSWIVVDQQHWQRAFSIRNNVVRKSFLLGAALFWIVPILLGILGFVAAGTGLVLTVNQTQLVGVFLIKNYLPQIGIYIFSFMVLVWLIAAWMSALSAAWSIWAVDLFRMIKKDITDKDTILISRITMIVVLLIAILVALIPNIQLLYLMFLIGVFRATLMLPTILSLYWSKLSTNFTFYWIILGMLLGVPLFIYWSVIKSSFISSFGSLMPIIISTIFCILWVMISPSNFNYEIFNKLYHDRKKKSDNNS